MPSFLKSSDRRLLIKPKTEKKTNLNWKNHQRAKPKNIRPQNQIVKPQQINIKAEVLNGSVQR